jgi:hypothetical protein
MVADSNGGHLPLGSRTVPGLSYQFLQQLSTDSRLVLFMTSRHGLRRKLRFPLLYTIVAVQTCLFAKPLLSSGSTCHCIYGRFTTEPFRGSHQFVQPDDCNSALEYVAITSSQKFTIRKRAHSLLYNFCTWNSAVKCEYSIATTLRAGDRRWGVSSQQDQGSLHNVQASPGTRPRVPSLGMGEAIPLLPRMSLCHDTSLSIRTTVHVFPVSQFVCTVVSSR